MPPTPTHSDHGSQPKSAPRGNLSRVSAWQHKLQQLPTYSTTTTRSFDRSRMRTPDVVDLYQRRLAEREDAPAGRYHRHRSLCLARQPGEVDVHQGDRVAGIAAHDT
eukprot:50918-Chlamydomonas_euryale.AAC.1